MLDLPKSWGDILKSLAKSRGQTKIGYVRELIRADLIKRGLINE